MSPVMRVREKAEHGVTLIEILLASIIVAFIAGGTLMAFLLASRISQSVSSTIDPSSLVQQTLEKFRNKIACRRSGESGPRRTPPGDTWYDSSCDADPPTGSPSDPLPAGTPLLQLGGARSYTVTPLDCDGVGGVGDCLQVRVKLTWTLPQ